MKRKISSTFQIIIHYYLIIRRYSLQSEMLGESLSKLQTNNSLKLRKGIELIEY
jgi:hypothetical protein